MSDLEPTPSMRRATDAKAPSSRMATVCGMPPRIVALTAVASAAALLLATLQSWPLWAIGLVTLLPWLPLFTRETLWTYRHYSWLALFYVLVVTQLAHLGEHLVQMVQIHLLDLQGKDARGVFGQLDIEWVHFLWNTWIILAVALLLTRFPRNPWLWVTLGMAAWHESEHAYIMWV